MSTYTFQLLALRKQPFSFTEGLASAFDYTPVSAVQRLGNAQRRRRSRIASDFIVTGNDMRTALVDYGRTR